jgi:hypothetical protein
VQQPLPLECLPLSLTSADARHLEERT